MFIVKAGSIYYGPFPTVPEAVAWATSEKRSFPNLPLDFTIIQLRAG